MRAEGYTLDIYCDNGAAHMIGNAVSYELAGGKAQFTSETGAKARRAARRAGWLVGRKRDLCPKCNPQRQTRDGQ